MFYLCVVWEFFFFIYIYYSDIVYIKVFSIDKKVYVPFDLIVLNIRLCG